MDLYAAALRMLLVRRDKEREVIAPEGLHLTEEQQVQLSNGSRTGSSATGAPRRPRRWPCVSSGNGCPQCRASSRWTERTRCSVTCCCAAGC
ncbi:hypothetical protein ID875_25690 [Streptomyces globisporus]|uniref:Uncharacterized protein n=1 Tax=Streptomyces globisporus TaxID=1908 RepID=A0A927BNK3_STRGL|nr:hypothetical protein [Streptomyces globisporus]